MDMIMWYNPLMNYQSLSDYLDDLRNSGDLCDICERVDPNLEVTEICDRAVKNSGPALLFKNVAGCGVPLAMNLFASDARMKKALGVKSYDEITARLENLLKAPKSSNFFEKMGQVPKLIEASNALPKVVKKENAACKEVVLTDAASIDLNSFPIIKCWPKDSGKFITFPLVITKNPVTGIQNIGMYRMQVLSRNETAMHWHKHKDGAYIAALHKETGGTKVPVSVVIGADPATMFSATAPLPNGVDEIMLAGFIRNKPVEIVKSELSDIMVPAHAEIILEGTVDLSDLRVEGPFGDHTGFYSPADNYPVFTIECITMRKNPVFIETIVGIPPMEDLFLGTATERIFLPLLKLQCPEVIDIKFPMAGVFHNLALVKIKKLYHGHPQKIMSYFWGQNQLMFTKNIVVFDENTDIHNADEALFMMLANVDFKRDVISCDGPLDILDHASVLEGYGPKVGIDATFKGGEPGCRKWPELIRMNENIKKAVDEKWEKLGIKKGR